MAGAADNQSAAPAGRFTLHQVQLDGVPIDLKTYDVLEDALRERDARAEGRDFRSIHFMVSDADDGERGYAEWCEECGVKGAFGHSCESCS